jgi:hypothetical protein
LSLLSVVRAQSFREGEAQRLYDVLDGLGCFESDKCELSDFKPTTACDYKPDHLQCAADKGLVKL